jgi:hypothetical protein
VDEGGIHCGLQRVLIRNRFRNWTVDVPNLRPTDPSLDPARIRRALYAGHFDQWIFVD